MYTKQDMDLYFKLFKWEGHVSDWYQYENPAQTKALFDEVECMGLRTGGGLLSVSAFLIAFKRLKDSGELKPVRAAMPTEEDEPELTAADYYKLSARETVSRFQSDPIFAASVQRLIDRGEI